MKNKFSIIAGILMIVIVLTVTIGFVSCGPKSDNQVDISLDGTWLVYQRGEDISRTEYLVFKGDTVSDYRDGSAEAFATSSYTLKGNTLSVPDLELTFTVEIISKNNIILTEPNTRVWRLLLVGNTDYNVEAVTSENIVGEYDVVVVGTQPRTNETISFTQTQFSFVQNGTETMSSKYELTNDHMLSLLDMNRQYAVYMNGDNLLFIGLDDNGVWELVRK